MLRDFGRPESFGRRSVTVSEITSDLLLNIENYPCEVSMREEGSMGQGYWAEASHLHSRWIKRLYSMFA